MKFYTDKDYSEYQEKERESKESKVQKKLDRNKRILSALLALDIILIGNFVFKGVKYEFSASNPFDGQKISSSDFIANYKYMKSRSFVEDDVFKGIIESIKASSIDEKKAYLLYYALLSNEYLTTEEKEKLTGYIQYFIDNKYLDYEYVYRKLYFLIVNPNDETLLEDGVAGNYNQDNNSITFANDSSRDYAMSHETFHSEDKFLFLNSSVDYKWFTEGLTELLSYEYNNSTIVYDAEVTFCRILCEFVGSDVLFETRAKGDMNILINSLVNKGIKREKVEKLFDLFNQYRWERKEENPDFNSLRIKIIDILGDCYLDISKNDEFVNPMFYQHILCLSNLQNSDSNIKYYFNSKKIKEVGVPSVIEYFRVAGKDGYIDSNSPTNALEKKEYYKDYVLEIREVTIDGITSTDVHKRYITTEGFNISIEGIISDIKENKSNEATLKF